MTNATGKIRCLLWLPVVGMSLGICASSVRAAPDQPVDTERSVTSIYRNKKGDSKRVVTKTQTKHQSGRKRVTTTKTTTQKTSDGRVEVMTTVTDTESPKD